MARADQTAACLAEACRNVVNRYPLPETVHQKMQNIQAKIDSIAGEIQVLRNASVSGIASQAIAQQPQSYTMNTTADIPQAPGVGSNDPWAAAGADPWGNNGAGGAASATGPASRDAQASYPFHHDGPIGDEVPPPPPLCI